MKAFVYIKNTNKRAYVFDDVYNAKFNKNKRTLSIYSELCGKMDFDTKKCKITLFQN